MTPSELSTRLNRFVFRLLENGIAIDVRSHSANASGGSALVTWSSPDADGAVFQNDFASLGEYLHFLKNGVFSAVLFDGSLLQISYELKRGQVVWHRLCYYPCPIQISIEELEEVTIADFIEEIDLPELKGRLRLNSPIRFDFDPQAANASHPSSHLTANRDCCRIPVRSYLDARRFIEFVFSNFYPDIWQKHTSVLKLSVDDPPLIIESDDQMKVHLHWSTIAPTA
jgi:hypothetical protein